MYLAYHFCALSPLRSCSIFICSCSCSACTLYTRLYYLIAAFRGEKKDQPILSSIFVLLFPMFTPSLNGVHATAECLVQRKLDNTIGIWFICQASSRTVQEAKLNHHKIWSHCLQSIGARSTYWLGTSRISVTCILKWRMWLLLSARPLLPETVYWRG